MTLRGRLMRALLLAIAPLLACSGLLVYMAVRSALLGVLDDGLAARAEVLSAMVKLEHGGVEFDASSGGLDRYAQRGSGEYFEVWQTNLPGGARLAYRSASLDGTGLEAERADEQARDARLADGREVRQLTRSFSRVQEPPDASEAARAKEGEQSARLRLIVAKDRSDVTRVLRAVALSMVGIGVCVLLALSLSMRWALARGLRPLREINAQIEQIGADDTTRRIDAGASPQELTPLLARTNEMLDRLSRAFERERRLSATAAHELRTPVAEIRATSELALSRERSSQEYRAALDTVHRASERTSSALDAVLRLARVRAGREAVRLEATSLYDTAGPTWSRLLGERVNRGDAVVFEVGPEHTVLADPALLAVAIENLIANAAEYAPRGASIRAWVREDEGARELVIENDMNTGPGAPEAGPGSDASSHANLGLSVASEIISALGGTLTAGPENAQFRARVRLRRV